MEQEVYPSQEETLWSREALSAWCVYAKRLAASNVPS